MIDTHLHLWNPATIRRAWLADVPELDRPFTLEDYQAVASRVGIDAAIHVETDVEPQEAGRELEEVTAAMKPPSIVRAAVVGGRPGQAGFDGWLERIADRLDVVGLRRVLHGPDQVSAAMLEPAVVADLRLLGARGLHFELCVRPDQLAVATRLVDACPKTRFVLDHLGRPDVAAGVTTDWSEGVRAMADRENVIAKLSGLIECAGGIDWTVETFRPFFELALDRFGPDRMLWGSNWPVCELGGSLERWVAATRSLLADHPEAVRAAVFHENARRVYRPGGAGGPD